MSSGRSVKSISLCLCLPQFMIPRRATIFIRGRFPGWTASYSRAASIALCVMSSTSVRGRRCSDARWRTSLLIFVIVASFTIPYFPLLAISHLAPPVCENFHPRTCVSICISVSYSIMKLPQDCLCKKRPDWVDEHEYIRILFRRSQVTTRQAADMCGGRSDQVLRYLRIGSGLGVKRRRRLIRYLRRMIIEMN